MSFTDFVLEHNKDFDGVLFEEENVVMGEDDSVDETEESMEEAYSRYVIDAIQLETAMVRVDSVCTEQYRDAETATDRAAVVSVYENAVTDFLSRSKDKLVKAVRAIWTWIKKNFEKLYKVVSVQIKAFFKKYGELFKGKKYDNVTVEFVKVAVPNFTELSLAAVQAAVDDILNCKDADELKEAEERHKHLLDDNIKDKLKQEIEDAMYPEGKSVKEVKFGTIKKDIIATLDKYPELAKKTEKVLNKPLNEINKIIEGLDKDTKYPDANKAAMKYARAGVSQCKKAISLGMYALGVIRSNSMKVARTVLHKGAVNEVDAKYTKKEATKESTLLNDMLATII